MNEIKKIETKRCSKCGGVKSFKEFHKFINGKYGLSCWCKECCKEYKKINKEKTKKYNKNYYKNNLEYHKNYYKNNKENYMKINIMWNENNPNRRKEIMKKCNIKRRLILKNKLNDKFSNSIRASIKNGKNGNYWEDLIGYNVNDLKNHLESRFKEGMNWNNYGRNGWSIDHIRPISSFNFNSYKDPEFKECWALENLQPLWESENISKGGIR